MPIPDDQESRSIFRLLLVLFTIGALILICGYLGKWAPGAP